MSSDRGEISDLAEMATEIAHLSELDPEIVFLDTIRISCHSNDLARKRINYKSVIMLLHKANILLHPLSKKNI